MSELTKPEIAAAGRTLLRLVPEDGPLDTPCWIWPGSRTPDGYGTIKVAGRVRYVHRLLYRVMVGEVPPGLQLHHECEEPSCGNPAHVRPVTRRENILLGRSISAQRARQVECIHGHPLDGRRSDGGRRCLTCHRESERERRALARAAA